jgi:hypothetical protein
MRASQATFIQCGFGQTGTGTGIHFYADNGRAKRGVEKEIRGKEIRELAASRYVETQCASKYLF